MVGISPAAHHAKLTHIIPVVGLVRLHGEVALTGSGRCLPRTRQILEGKFSAEPAFRMNAISIAAKHAHAASCIPIVRRCRSVWKGALVVILRAPDVTVWLGRSIDSTPAALYVIAICEAPLHAVRAVRLPVVAKHMAWLVLEPTCLKRRGLRVLRAAHILVWGLTTESTLHVCAIRMTAKQAL